jgi:hypothetical protein
MQFGSPRTCGQQREQGDVVALPHTVACASGRPGTAAEPSSTEGGRRAHHLAYHRRAPPALRRLRLQPPQSPTLSKHAFGSGQPFTLGVEEELLLVDPVSGCRSRHGDPRVQRAAPPPPAAAGAGGQLAVSSRPRHRSGLGPRGDDPRLAALGRAARDARLRGVLRHGGAAGARRRRARLHVVLLEAASASAAGQGAQLPDAEGSLRPVTELLDAALEVARRRAGELGCADALDVLPGSCAAVAAPDASGPCTRSPAWGRCCAS